MLKDAEKEKLLMDYLFYHMSLRLDKSRCVGKKAFMEIVANCTFHSMLKTFWDFPLSLQSLFFYFLQTFYKLVKLLRQTINGSFSI